MKFGKSFWIVKEIRALPELQVLEALSYPQYILFTDVTQSKINQHQRCDLS